jgi:hypothetical protein
LSEIIYSRNIPVLKLPNEAALEALFPLLEAWFGKKSTSTNNVIQLPFLPAK